jgi:putative Mg2+ transporter-C (MgtC) family protein
MSIEILDLLKLLFACLAGGLIGVEREFRDKSAGFRTLILICLGATLFTMMSPRFAAIGDPGRIAAGIVSGIGFLGAGVILRDRGRIMGLTTAATIWMTAAIGMAIGGQFLPRPGARVGYGGAVDLSFSRRRFDLVREPAL